ncbi:MAG: hypothetical protein HY322_12140 [Betaproteobacteria bacterium]|nr:hypothetical protein [Betaproteobacteria bacterium]
MVSPIERAVRRLMVRPIPHNLFHPREQGKRFAAPRLIRGVTAGTAAQAMSGTAYKPRPDSFCASRQFSRRRLARHDLEVTLQAGVHLGAVVEHRAPKTLHKKMCRNTWQCDKATAGKKRSVGGKHVQKDPVLTAIGRTHNCVVPLFRVILSCL